MPINLNTLINILDREIKLVFKGKREKVVEHKKDGSYVTDLDKNLSSRIQGILRLYFPNDTIIDEEQPPKIGDSGREWFVDPLDSTESYVQGRPGYTSLVGFSINGELAFGYVNDLARERTYSAIRGDIFIDGFKLNKQPQSRRTRLITSRRQLGFKDRLTEADPRLQFEEVKLSKGALKIIDVALGNADICIYSPHSVELYDVCAPATFALASGCSVTNLLGNRFTTKEKELNRGLIISRNPYLVEQIVSALE